MAKYLMIESSSGFVENIILWDGLIEEWNTSSGFILQEVTDTEPMDFVITDNNINFSQIPRNLLDFVESSSLSIFPPNITGYIGSFTGSLTGSFNDYSGSLGWLDEFASSSRSGSFTGSFTGSLEGTASYTLTASYLDILKAGTVRFNEWGLDGTINNYYTSSVTFSSSYSNNSYAISLTCGADVRTLSITNKTVSGFEINSNSSTTMTDNVYWIAVPYNNP